MSAMPRTSRKSRLGLLVLLLAAAPPAFAQGWFPDRLNNSIGNVDAIAARYREQVQDEVARLTRRPVPLPGPSAREQDAIRAADAWWLRQVQRPVGEPGTPVPVSLGFLYDSALLNSPQMRVFGDLPAIRDTLHQEVEGRYVWRGYAEGRAEDVNDPTRSLANTRGSSRLLQRERALEFGVRQRTLTGGDITVGQRFVNLSSNSLDLQPSNQTRSRSFVTVVQPILRDSGLAYVRSLHEVARLDGRTALSEFRRQVESHLLEVSRAYWAVHLARASYLQKQRVAEAVRPLVGQVEGRSDIDIDPLLASRARAALASREADLLRARGAIRNAEARLRGLVNDPRFDSERIGELLPMDTPLLRHEPLTLPAIVERAVAFRPEVEQAFLQHRAAVLREGQAQIEALPRLDVIAEANIGGRGLGNGQYGAAWSDSRNNMDRLGGMLGMRLEVPLQQDDLRARLDRRRLETRQVENQGRATLATILTEGEVVLNEYNVAYREIGARSLALRAARTDLNAETERWRQGVSGRDGGAANALERLLGAQDRLADAEEKLAAAQANCTLAFLAVQRVQGTFTALENLQIERVEQAARGPSYSVRRNRADAPGAQPAATPNAGR